MNRSSEGWAPAHAACRIRHIRSESAGWRMRNAGATGKHTRATCRFCHGAARSGASAVGCDVRFVGGPGHTHTTGAPQGPSLPTNSHALIRPPTAQPVLGRIWCGGLAARGGVAPCLALISGEWTESLRWSRQRRCCRASRNVSSLMSPASVRRTCRRLPYLSAASR